MRIKLNAISTIKYIYIRVYIYVFMRRIYIIVTPAINYLAKGIRRCAGAFVNVKYVPGALV